MRRRFAGWIPLVVLLSMPAAAGRESPCDWPRADDIRQLDLRRGRDRRHLSDDALLAEDRAIRHADACCGPRSGAFEGRAQYSQARDECMATLFGIIARNHGVAPQQVREGLGSRRTGVDLLVTLSFALLYSLAVMRLARGLFRSSWAGEARSAVAAVVVVSLVASIAGVFVGELWALAIEAVRIGNGHLSYRIDRIPWLHHRWELFAAGVVLFWVIAALPAVRAHRGQWAPLTRGRMFS